MRLARQLEVITLFLQLDSNAIDQFPQAVIINTAGSIIGTVNLSSVAGVGGKYSGTFQFTNLGDYSIKFVVFKDSGHTEINAQYSFADEVIRVSDVEDGVQSILDKVSDLEDGIDININRDPVAIFD